MACRILVTFPLGGPDRQLLAAGAVGCELRFAALDSIDDRDLVWADTVFGNVKPPGRITDRVNIRWLHSPNVGLDGYAGLIEARPELRVTNARGIADEAVSDHAMALLLAFTRRIPLMVTGRHGKEWARQAFAGAACGTLAAMNVHVLGYGSTGRCLVRKLRGFGARVTIYRRLVEGEDPDSGRFVLLSQLAGCVGDADALINLLPSVPETRRRIDGGIFAAMKPGALFVNVGRGATVDEAALIAAIECGHLGGAALDVFENEPLPRESRLWSLPNVVISPHVAGRFAGESRRQVELFLERLADLKGR